jgi:AbrB family looped-hinge helix DNA binding protein
MRKAAMRSLATTRMSSRGQVVIPEEIRKALKLTEGNQFVVLGENDVIMLKVITPPSMKNFDKLIAQARKQKIQSGIKKTDILKSIKKVRKKKKT